MVESQGWLGNPPGALAHAPGHPALLERCPPSADPRQGGALPRCARTCARPARTAAPRAAALARRLSLGAQPPPPPRGSGHASPRQPLATQSAPLQSEPAALGVPARRLGAQDRLPGETRPEGKKMARQQSPCRRVCPATSHPTAPHGLLLLHLDARNRSCCPALHDRAALGNRSSNHNRNVTHVPGQSVTDVMRLDSTLRDGWDTRTFRASGGERAKARTTASARWRMVNG